MTPQELKTSLLLSAYKGLLVPQNESEGTGDQLFSDIQRRQFGEKKKSKSSDLIPEDIPFDIPFSWRWVHIDDIADSSLGKTLNSEKDDGELSPYLCSINVYWDVINLSNIKTARFSEKDKEKYRLQKGDLLMCEGGEAGRSALWLSDQEMYYQNALHRMRFYQPLDARFFLYLFWLYKNIGQIKKYTKGETIQHLVQRSLYSIPIPFPPLLEQRRIIEKIEILLPLIDEYGSAWEKLETLNRSFPESLRNSIFQSAITGSLINFTQGGQAEAKPIPTAVPKRPKNTKNELKLTAMDFPVPTSWSFVELSHIFNFVDYRGKTPHKIKEGVFLVTASNIKKGFMDYSRKEYISYEEFETRKERGLTALGDLLFTTEAPMGNVALCDLPQCSCGQRIITLKERVPGTIIPELYMWFMLSPAFQRQLLDNCTGTTAKGIKAAKLKRLLLPLPPMADQKRLVQKIKELLSFCNSLSKTIISK